MTHIIQVTDTILAKATFFADPEDNLSDSSISYSLMDEEGTVYLGGDSTDISMVEIPSGNVKITTTQNITIPDNLVLDKPGTFLLVWKLITPASVTYTYTEEIEVHPFPEEKEDVDFVELQGHPVTLSVVFPHLAIPSARLYVSDVTVPEGTLATFTFTLDREVSTPVSFDYTTVPVTAADGTDFTSATGTITIPANTLVATVDIATLHNMYDSEHKRFLLQLSNIDGAEFGISSAVCTIENIDVQSISINNLVIDPATEVFAEYTVTLAVASEATVTVDFATYARNAVAGVDFTSVTGTLTFTPGQTEKQVTVPIINPAAGLIDEAFVMQLSNPVNAVLSNNYLGITDLYVYDNTCVIANGDWATPGNGKEIDISDAYNPVLRGFGFYGIDTRCGFAAVGNPGLSYSPVPQGDTLILDKDELGNWQPDQIVFAATGHADDGFGTFIKFYSENIVLIGAPTYIDPAYPGSSGAIFVFVREQGGTWTERGRLHAKADGAALPYGFFGTAFALSGNTLVATAPFDALAPASAYVYTTTDGIEWTLTQELQPASIGALDKFGTDVAVSGNFLAISAPAYTEEAQGGSIFLYEKLAGTWTEVDRLIPGDQNNTVIDQGFGYRLAFCADKLVVSSPNYDPTGLVGTQPNTGALYVYETATWTLDQIVVHQASAQDKLYGIAGSNHNGLCAIGSVSHNDIEIYDMSTVTYINSVINNPPIADSRLLGTNISLSGNRILAPRIDASFILFPAVDNPAELHWFDAPLL